MKALRYAGFAALATLLLAGAAAGSLAYAIYGDRSHPVTPSQIIVARGSSFAEVTRELAAGGVIANVLTFRNSRASARRRSGGARRRVPLYAAPQSESGA